MSVIVWLVMGSLVGWIASVIMGASTRQGMIPNVVVGMVGALIGGWLIGPLRGVGSINYDMTIPSFSVSLVGAVVMLAILSFYQRNAIR